MATLQPGPHTSLRVRVRSRRACDSCRKRKKKCNGSQPCEECIGYGYECSFRLQPSKASNSDRGRPGSNRAPRDETQAVEGQMDFLPAEVSEGDKDMDESNSAGLQQVGTGKFPALAREAQELSVLEPYKSRFMGASSAVAFARGVGMELGMACPPRLHSYGWNIGIRPERLGPTVTRLRDLMSLEDSMPFFDSYFDAINPLYGILNRDSFIHRCAEFWSLRSIGTALEAIICGVISLGSFFSNGNPCAMEWELVEHAKLLLESSVSQPPALVCLDHVVAWILRSLYLRLTTRPHLSWLASCTTMHLAESTGLHQDIHTIQSAVDGFSRSLDVQESDYRRRVFWVAWSLNRLLSAEYSRSPTYLDNIRCCKPSADKNDYTTDLIAIVEIIPRSALPGSSTTNNTGVEVALSQISLLPDEHPVLVLLKADICLMLCRRLWAKMHKLSTEQIDHILPILRSAFVQVQVLSRQYQPWWNLVSVPFQSLCLFISINSPRSIEMMSEAMETLKIVSSVYDTHMIREAVNVAGRLIRRFAERKREDLIVLDGLYKGQDDSSAQRGECSDTSMFANLTQGLPGEDLYWMEFFNTELT